MAETSAAVEPEMPEKRISATTATIARPPRTRPTMAIARSTMRSEMPPDSMRAPATMKSGMASRTNESTPPRILMGRMIEADAADAKEIGERCQRQGERERNAERRGHEKAGHEDDDRRRPGEERDEHRREREPGRACGPGLGAAVLPHGVAVAPQLLHEDGRHQHAATPAGRRRSRHPRGRWREGARAHSQS